jgi:thioredoxin 1
MASQNVKFVSDDEFPALIANSTHPVLVDFTATWCGPCKAIAPILDQIADANLGKLTIVKMDIDENPNTPNQFGVQSIPTLLLFQDGKLVDRRVGSANKTVLDAFVGRVLA